MVDQRRFIDLSTSQSSGARGSAPPARTRCGAVNRTPESSTLQGVCFLLGISALLLLTAASVSAQDQAVVIRNARVHTLSPAGTLERATVVIADGKIKGVGASVKSPAGARVIDGRGLEVYPGMINAWSSIGLTEIGAVDVTNDSREQGSYKPQLLAFSAINPASEHLPVARVNGITTSMSVPAGGVIAGQAVLLHLDGWTADEMAILKSAGMVISFPSLGPSRGASGTGFARTARRGFPEIKREYENQVKELSEWFEKARHYARARQANPSTPADLQLEALIPVVQGRMTVFLVANSARDIRNAVEFGRKEKLKFVIQGGLEADQIAELLKKENVSLILDPVIALPTREDDAYDARFTLPSALAKAGIKFAIASTGSSDLRNLPYEAGVASAYGLPRDEALRAVTLNPAEILGVADRVGSIEAGKIADLVVTDGDLLEMRTQVKYLFIAGRGVSLETRHTRLYEQYRARP